MSGPNAFSMRRCHFRRERGFYAPAVESPSAPPSWWGRHELEEQESRPHEQAPVDAPTADLCDGPGFVDDQLGLDQPLPVQFWHYLTHAVKGDLGQSSVTRTPVLSDLAQFLPVTLELLLVALILYACSWLLVRKGGAAPALSP